MLASVDGRRTEHGRVPARRARGARRLGAVPPLRRPRRDLAHERVAADAAGGRGREHDAARLAGRRPRAVGGARRPRVPPARRPEARERQLRPHGRRRTRGGGSRTPADASESRSTRAAAARPPRRAGGRRPSPRSRAPARRSVGSPGSARRAARPPPRPRPRGDRSRSAGRGGCSAACCPGSARRPSAARTPRRSTRPARGSGQQRRASREQPGGERRQALEPHAVGPGDPDRLPHRRRERRGERPGAPAPPAGASPVIAGAAFSWFTTSFDHCSPARSAAVRTSATAPEHRRPPPAAAPPVAESRASTVTPGGGHGHDAGGEEGGGDHRRRPDQRRGRQHVRRAPAARGRRSARRRPARRRARAAFCAAAAGRVLRLHGEQRQLGRAPAAPPRRRAGRPSSPYAPSSRSPCSRIAASCSPRAVTTTSWPARSSSAANVPPSAPAPIDCRSACEQRRQCRMGRWSA